jgi:hypothetical protein
MNTVLDKAFVVLARTRRHSIGHLMHRAMEAEAERRELQSGIREFAVPENTQQTANSYVELTKIRQHRRAPGGGWTSCAG